VKGNCKLKLGEVNLQVLSPDMSKVIGTWMFESMDGWEGNKDMFSFKSTHPKKENIVLQIKGGKEKVDQVRMRFSDHFVKGCWHILARCSLAHFRSNVVQIMELMNETAKGVQAEMKAQKKVQNEEVTAAKLANMPKAGRRLKQDDVVEGMPVRSPQKKTDDGKEMTGKVVKRDGKRVQVDFSDSGGSKSWLTVDDLVSDAELKEGEEEDKVHYQAVAPCVVRKAAAKDSENIGQLPMGEVIVCISTEEVGGTTRVQFDTGKLAGWTSVAASNGTKLLDEVPPGTKSAEKTADKKDEKKKDEKKKKTETPKKIEKEKPKLSAEEQAVLDESQNSFDAKGVKGVKGACRVKIGQINIQVMSPDGMKPLGSWMYERVRVLLLSICHFFTHFDCFFRLTFDQMWRRWRAGRARRTLSSSR
jgi:hypothetical protein